MHNVKKPNYDVKKVLETLSNKFSSQQISNFISEETEYKNNIEKNINKIKKKKITDISVNLAVKALYKYDFCTHVKPKAIYKELMESSAYCPFCGLNESNELDHFLPKSKYETLSIVPLNLIPICTVCNRKKGSIVPLINGTFFINPYYHQITNWLSFSLDSSHGISFLMKKIDRSIPHYSEIVFTMEKLELDTRINVKAIAEFNDLKETLKNMKSLGEDKLKEFLNLIINNQCNNIRNEIYKCILNNFDEVIKLI